MPQTCSSCNSPIADDAAHCSACGAIAPTAIGSEARTEPFLATAQDSSPEAIQGRLTRALGPNYEVRSVVGRGGFATVYELWDRNLERQLAAKVLIPEVAWTPGTLERFKQEARTVARLNHPNILPIHFVGDGEDLAFYVMPFVKGESLKDRLQAGRLGTDDVVEIGMQVLDALAHAHEDGMVHRDIKPDNVMIDARTGRALLVDFGIAKALDPRRASNMTQAGFAVGTPHYMSPEQTLGDPIDGRSDIYSFGVMLFEMVTGRKPFVGETSQEIVAKHIADAPPDPREIDESVPAWLAEVVLRCMEKPPADRFQAAGDAIKALREREVAPSAGEVGDVLGGEIVQGSGFDDDDLFVFQDPSAGGSSDEQVSEEEVVVSAPEETNDEPVSVDPQRVPPAGDESVVAEDVAPIEVESLEPRRTEEDTEAVGGEGAGETTTEPEAEPRPVQTLAGDRERLQEEAPKKSGNGLLLAGLGIVTVVVLALGAAFAGFGPQALQDLMRGRLNLPVGGGDATANQIVFTNSLVESVDLLVDGEIDRRIAPGARTELPLSGHVGSSLSWTLIRPLGADSTEMGQTFSIELAARAESESSRQYVISASVAGNRIVAPEINNFSDHDIVVQVVSGNSGLRCNCRVAAGARGYRIGYYPLDAGTTIRAYDAATPYRGTFEQASDFFSDVDALSGSVEITFRRGR